MLHWSPDSAICFTVALGVGPTRQFSGDVRAGLPSGTVGLRNNAADVVESLTNADGGSLVDVHVRVRIVPRRAVVDDDGSAAGDG